MVIMPGMLLRLRLFYTYVPSDLQLSALVILWRCEKPLYASVWSRTVCSYCGLLLSFDISLPDLAGAKDLCEYLDRKNIW